MFIEVKLISGKCRYLNLNQVIVMTYEPESNTLVANVAGGKFVFPVPADEADRIIGALPKVVEVIHESAR